MYTIDGNQRINYKTFETNVNGQYCKITIAAYGRGNSYLSNYCTYVAYWFIQSSNGSSEWGNHQVGTMNVIVGGVRFPILHQHLNFSSYAIPISFVSRAKSCRELTYNNLLRYFQDFNYSINFIDFCCSFLQSCISFIEQQGMLQGVKYSVKGMGSAMNKLMYRRKPLNDLIRCSGISKQKTKQLKKNGWTLEETNKNSVGARVQRFRRYLSVGNLNVDVQICLEVADPGYINHAENVHEVYEVRRLMTDEIWTDSQTAFGFDDLNHMRDQINSI